MQVLRLSTIYMMSLPRRPGATETQGWSRLARTRNFSAVCSERSPHTGQTINGSRRQPDPEGQSWGKCHRTKITMSNVHYKCCNTQLKPEEANTGGPWDSANHRGRRGEERADRQRLACKGVVSGGQELGGTFLELDGVPACLQLPPTHSVKLGRDRMK